MRVVVVGGTGLIGSRVANGLRDHGVEVRVGSRRTGVDTYNDRGVAELFAGADVVIDATNMNRPAHDYEQFDYEQSRDFFETSARNILGAELDTGVQHHIGISMIGVSDIDSEYFHAKAAQERLAGATSTPHTIVRITMLHELVPRIVEHAATTHLVRLPPVRVQPVAADDVASELVHRALGEALNGVFELAGPEVYFLDELAREVLSAEGDTRRVVADDAARYLGARLEPGTRALLPAWRTATSTFEDWLRTSGPNRTGRSPLSHA